MHSIVSHFIKHFLMYVYAKSVHIESPRKMHLNCITLMFQSKMLLIRRNVVHLLIKKIFN